MVENNVESVLREIRARVYAEQEVQSAAAPVIPHIDRVATGTNGDMKRASAIEDAIARLRSQLTVTQRAWDRLPPVNSERAGVFARVELWLKRRMKRATRWYAWEQINFNAAVNQSLSEIAEILAAQTRQLDALLQAQRQQELLSEQQFAAHAQELEKLRQQLSVKLELQRRDFDRLELSASARNTEHNARLDELRQSISEMLSQMIESQRAAFISEITERDDRLMAEQRVCFKQLSLEAGESASLEDRARRKTEMELAEIKLRLEQLENQK